MIFNIFFVISENAWKHFGFSVVQMGHAEELRVDTKIDLLVVTEIDHLILYKQLHQFVWLCRPYFKLHMYLIVGGALVLLSNAMKP